MGFKKKNPKKKPQQLINNSFVRDYKNANWNIVNFGFWEMLLNFDAN